MNRVEGEVERKLGAYAVFLREWQPASARLPATPGSGAGVPALYRRSERLHLRANGWIYSWPRLVNVPVLSREA